MASTTDQLQAAGKIQSFSMPEADAIVGAHHPSLVVRVNINIDISKSAAPFHHARVIVRVRDRYRGGPAQAFDAVDGCVVQQADAIPQNISRRVLNQRRALSNSKLRFN